MFKTKKLKRLINGVLTLNTLLPLLIIAFAALSVFFIFYLSQGFNQKPIPHNQQARKTHQKLPVRLVIPTINVNANIQRVGIAPNGEMDAPNNTVDVGWFGLGPSPGEIGNAVIGGHFNGENNNVGVFTNLYKLKEGDKIYIVDNNGKSTAFVVRKSRTYNPGYAYDVFSPSDNAHLNLITCGGTWNETKKSYSERLVVFADIIS